MIFNFELLGLLIVFGLVIIYYSKTVKKNEENIIFRNLMIITYIVELLYIASYITINQNINSLLYIKLYLIFTSIAFSFLSLYYIVTGLKNKYLVKQTIYNNKVKLAMILYIFLNVITTTLILITKVNLNDNIVTGVPINLTYIFIAIYTIINILSMLSYFKYFSPKKNYNLSLILIISIISILIGYFFERIPAINYGLVLLVLFMYLTEENYSSKEIEKLELERDHARENIIDKSKFLRNISHELRIPLNTIDGFSQVILDSNDLQSIKEDAKDIRTASKNIIDIINGLIDMSVIESGALEILAENYNVYAMLDNIESIAKSRMINNKVKFLTKIDSNIPKVLLGDSERIEQVILNIITNSIKYTNAGSITMQVDAVKSSSICRLKISIIDTGIGIKKEDINKIFDKDLNDFTKENDSYSLKLVYSKQLLELMNGKIDIESSVGIGSTFTITLDQKIVTEDKEIKKVSKKEIKPFDASDKKILLVDDNKLNIKVAAKLLEPYKVKIIEATSGQECLDILDNDTNFNLILMDDLMPNMSGTETLDILKKIERVEGFSIPVVVLTANAVSGMKAKYLAKGFDDYLAKPIDKSELNRVLKKYLEKNKTN